MTPTEIGAAPGPDRASVSRAIRRLQSTDRYSRKGPPTYILHEFIAAITPIVWDDERALFWVKSPNEGWQVAVWMMDVAMEFEPAARLRAIEEMKP